MPSYVGRLAPSPTGALHLGNARSFLAAWLDCRVHHGKLLMRLEDLNIVRMKEGAVEGAYHDLTWMGLDWDGGAGMEFLSLPRDLNEANFIQSNRTAVYAEVLNRLHQQGLAYPCVCTRREVREAQDAPHEGQDSHELCYPGICRGKYTDERDAKEQSGREPSWRFRIDERTTCFLDRLHGEQVSRLSEWSGDFVIGLSGERVAYQLAVVMDDIFHGVTRVLRGDDLLKSTHRQLFLYDALEASPPEFFHLPLVVGMDGRRLAKRHGDLKLSTLRQLGVPPEQMVGWLAQSLGISVPNNEAMPWDLIDKWDPDAIPKEQIIVTPETLKYFRLDNH